MPSHDGDEPVVVDAFRCMHVTADHRFRRDERIEDGLLGGFDGGDEEVVDARVSDVRRRADRVLAEALDAIPGRIGEGEQQVTRLVPRDGPRPAETE